jgi:uncharacterized DUF497 family protein
MRFDWDARKARSNLTKHGVSFELAITVFDDPFALVAADDKHSTSVEQRVWIVGESDLGVLVVVYTIRDKGGTNRLISARRAGRRERRQYEDSRRIPL